MTPEQILAVLRARRVPHDRIAEAINRDRSAATKMLNGIRSIKASEIGPLTELALEALREVRPDDIEQAARAFDGLQEGGPAWSAAPAASELTVGRAVQAGAWLEVNALDQREPERYPAAPDPRYPRARQWLSPVLGDSMNALTKGGAPAGILQGDLVHLVDAIDIDYRPTSGDVVCVERSRFSGREREVTLKQIEVLPDGAIELWPRSTNPAFAHPVPYHPDEPASAGADDIEVRIAAKMLRVIRAF